MLENMHSCHTYAVLYCCVYTVLYLEVIMMQLCSIFSFVLELSRPYFIYLLPRVLSVCMILLLRSKC